MILSICAWATTLLAINGQAATPTFDFDPVYRFEILARTGSPTVHGDLITWLGAGPSINDAGHVAHTLRTADGREWVAVSGEPSVRSSLVETFSAGFSTFSGLSRNFAVSDFVQINNQGQVA